MHTPLAVNSLVVELKDIPSIALSSAARDRDEYLKRPDLGRRLSEESRERLGALRGDYDAAFVIADGLSALAVHRHAVPLLELLSATWIGGSRPSRLSNKGGWRLATKSENCWGRKWLWCLIGERPGLSSPDSLGAYLTWQPRPGRTDAERNCVSNIRSEGLSYPAAAHKLLFLMNESRRLKLSGVRLKEAAALIGDSMIQLQALQRSLISGVDGPQFQSHHDAPKPTR